MSPIQNSLIARPKVVWDEDLGWGVGSLVCVRGFLLFPGVGTAVIYSNSESFHGAIGCLTACDSAGISSWPLFCKNLHCLFTWHFLTFLDISQELVLFRQEPQWTTNHSPGTSGKRADAGDSSWHSVTTLELPTKSMYQP